MLWPHYPLHYGMTRPFAREALKQLEAQPRDALGPRTAERTVCELLLPYLQQKGWTVDRVSVFSQELQGALAWLDWALNGKRLITVAAPLTRAFERSDCGDMRIRDVLAERAGTLYLHFQGPLAHPVRYAQGRAEFEGAYVVLRSDSSLRIVLCSRLDPAVGVHERWLERYDLRISSSHFDLPADTAMDLALADDLQDIREAQRKFLDAGHTAALQEACQLEQRMVEDHPGYRIALRLILNALAYLKTYPQERRATWTDQAPERLIRAVESGTPKEAARARSKLWGLGHLPVDLIGSHFKLSGVEGEGGLKQHWRQGHWRHQRHGEGWSLTKLIWIQPVLVNAPSS